MAMKANKRVTLEKAQLKWGYIFIAPCIIGLILFRFGPMIFSLIMSFTDWTIIQRPNFIGLENFRRLANDRLVWLSVRVTLHYTLLSVPLVTVSCFFIASLLNTGVKGISIYRTIFYIPSVVPIVASSALWRFIFDPMFGLMNSILRFFELPPQQWIFSQSGVIPGLAIMAVWGSGNAVVIYLAGLQGISKELYESADLDGANSFQRLTRITIPLMTPIIFFNFIMGTIGALQTFTQALIMTNGGPANASLFMSLYIYRTAFTNQNMGYASAMSWLLFIIVAIFTAIIFKTSKNWVYYETKVN